ncbi:MAG: hypothetical protein H6861_07375 [Rhodospirillales bacterium]|nr:hypothetical protein [Rhodospirillales bacterium]
MIKRLSFLLVVAALVALPGAASRAQNCNIEYEAIVKLREPTVGSYNVWDSIYGEIPTDERFKSAIVLETGTVLATGALIDPQHSDRKDVLLAEIGRNGRVLWGKTHEVAGLADVVKVIPHDKGAMVLANITPEKGRRYLWLGIFNLQGDLLSSKTIKDRTNHVRGHDVEFGASEKSYIVAASAATVKGDEPGWSVLYRVNTSGGVISDHAFVIGSENAMYDLFPMDDGGYVASGYIDNASGRKTGWLMRLADDLRMMWQQSYARGAGAELVRGHTMLADTLAVVGTALPSGEGNRAAWVMVVNGFSGDVIWQRYLNGALHFDGRDVMVSEDGLISVLIDGQAPENSGEVEHVRLLTLNPRGVMFSSDEFFNGEAVNAYALMPSKGAERLIIGDTKVAYKIEHGQNADMPGPQMPDEVVSSLEGWVVGATGVDPYLDPCRVKKRELP